VTHKDCTEVKQTSNEHRTKVGWKSNKCWMKRQDGKIVRMTTGRHGAGQQGLNESSDESPTKVRRTWDKPRSQRWQRYRLQCCNNDGAVAHNVVVVVALLLLQHCCCCGAAISATLLLQHCCWSALRRCCWCGIIAATLLLEHATALLLVRHYCCNITIGARYGIAIGAALLQRCCWSALRHCCCNMLLQRAITQLLQRCCWSALRRCCCNVLLQRAITQLL